MNDIELAQEVQIFLPKSLPTMMPFLILDVADDGRELRMRVRKGTKSFLPVEASSEPFAAIDEIG
jgi:hypothetical protein